MTGDFERIAIINRGEPAMRLIHAVRELNREQGTAMETVALYTEPDRNALFVREADAAFDLGPATYLDPADGQRKVSYLDYGRLERALLESRADAAWVGWGFVAEHAAFAELCARLGVVFIGPGAEVMRRLGDKITSKLLAEQAGAPMAPWSGGPVDSVEEALAHAERLGFPLMIKATAGGGGRGIRRIGSADELAQAFADARAEAHKAFGDPTVFLERMVRGARHVEVQIIADHHGTTWAVGVRDCTIQRRNQKVLEETPSPALTAEQDRDLRAAAVRICQAAGYANAGTVEFLYDPQSRELFFMEVNTRLQVEHPVTEATTGLDLVKLQIHVARGGRLAGEPPAARGHAIEVRLNAEDPENGFAPAPGLVEVFRLPTGPGLRIDTGVEEGDEVAPQFDSMIAKIISHGRDRAEALARLSRALAQTAVVIRGGTSNKGFLQGLLERPEVISGEVEVGWLDGVVRQGEHLPRRHGEIALLQGAIEAYEAQSSLEKTRFFASARRGRPEVGDQIGQQVELGYQGQMYSLHVSRLGPRRYRVATGERRVEVLSESLGRAGKRLLLGGESHRVYSVAHGLGYLVEVDGEPHRLNRDEAGTVRAPGPAVVVAISVEEGSEVAAGDRLVVLEAMKMEMSIVAEFPGRVRKVLVRKNVQVPAGTPLLEIEATGHGDDAGQRPRLTFARLPTDLIEAADGRPRCQRTLEELRWLLLGYDVDPAELQRIVEEHGLLCDGVPADDEEMRRLEDDVLRCFVDLCSLFRRQPGDGEAAEEGRRSTQEYLFAYLQNPEAKGRELPPAFLGKLERALAHYGVDKLDRSPALEESLYRISKSQQRMERQLAPILSILDRRLEGVEALRPTSGAELRTLLERMIGETRGRFPAVHDLAREVHYRYFHQPFLDRVREQIYLQAEDHLERLAAAPGAGDRGERIRALVDCPQPLHALLAERYGPAPTPLREAMLEVMTRRYYRIRALEQLRPIELGDHTFATAEYDHEGRHIHLFTTRADYRRLGEAAEVLCPMVEALPRDHDVVTDFYLWRDSPLPDPEATRQEILGVLDQSVFPCPLRRVVVTVSGPSSGRARGGVQHFTLRPTPEGYEEEKLYRGLHPMMGKRLQIWRLGNFDIERLPSVEDVYLFRGVARGNPSDERLIALAEVRDLTPLGDVERELHLPQFERVLHEALAGIRRFQSRRSPERRLHWNQVQLHVWPPLELPVTRLRSLIRRLEPATADLGLEKLVIWAQVPDGNGGLADKVVEVSNPGGRGVLLQYLDSTEEPVKPLSDYDQKVVRLLARGLPYPYEIVKMLTPPRDRAAADLPAGEFQEYDLDADQRLVPVDRPYGGNRSNIVVGVVRSFTSRYPEGMARVILLGDPSRGMGNLAEGECRRILAGLDLAREMGVPVEWFALSAGAKIAMDSGTENMDWIGQVLRRLVELTQEGHEVNVVVTGINVGAQPYWNAEATMLMHTRGILVMTPDSAMVLTGKQALDYSGGVSAEDNQGIGGYERIMGPNGQAQYFARDLSEACRILLRYYEHTYRAPGERFPRRAATTDPRERDVRGYPHGGEFQSVGEVFSDVHNPGRKKPFDVRRVMMATVDQDHPPLERWFGMEDAEIAVVWDAHLGGIPICLLGLESRPLPRFGFVPAYGPDQWTAGTLFPQSSKKLARAINSASGNRPVVVLANLSGFDGSPESMLKLQLEHGAEIGRAVVNFRGPFIFCDISRYHGGAFVVFSNALNESMEVAALEGAYASVIGGAPAAAVVFGRDVDKRTRKDPRHRELEEQLSRADGVEKARLRARLQEVYEVVRSEKLGEVAAEFDQVHDVYRAQRVGSIHHIIPPADLRPYLIGALERGMERELERQRPETVVARSEP